MLLIEIEDPYEKPNNRKLLNLRLGMPLLVSFVTSCYMEMS